jgi:hypothetical protein
MLAKPQFFEAFCICYNRPRKAYKGSVKMTYDKNIGVFYLQEFHEEEKGKNYKDVTADAFENAQAKHDQGGK